MKNKKSLMTTVIMMLICLVSQAQVFQKGSKVFHVGLGIGTAYLAAGLTTDVPPLNASFEYGITDKIGVGGQLGYYAGSNSTDFPAEDDQGNFVNATLKNSVTAFVIGVRGTYHFLTTDKYDLYACGMLSYNSASNTFTLSPSGAQALTALPTASYSGVVPGAVGGARYFFNKNIGAYAEVGYSIAFVNFGLSVKF